MHKRTLLLAATTLSLAACDKAETPVSIAGSAGMQPFTQAVADKFHASGKDRPAPTIEMVGVRAGVKTFCAGPGAPDILDASRRISKKEFATCIANKVGDVMEIPVGLDGIALVESNDGPKLSVTNKDLYLALAAAPKGVPNAAKMWSDVNPKLPKIPIKLLGPPAAGGTLAAFVTLVIEPGCLAANPDAIKLRSSGDPAKFEMACRRVRTDAAYVDSGLKFDATTKALEQDPKAVGLVPYPYLSKNSAKLHGIPINGVAPDADTIAKGTYPAVRQLYLYVKKGHIAQKPSVQDFVTLYSQMWGAGGPLAEKGLIPLPERLNKSSLEIIKNGYPLEIDDLP